MNGLFPFWAFGLHPFQAAMQMPMTLLGSNGYGEQDTVPYLKLWYQSGDIPDFFKTLFMASRQGLDLKCPSHGL
ncbi:MAG: hypothetical protein CSA81_03465 [Acidobacteria bacterium]|nr:MAG: hypothetical protein CSA81_03465 [Acidobacteriota bacterium]